MVRKWMAGLLAVAVVGVGPALPAGAQIGPLSPSSEPAQPPPAPAVDPALATFLANPRATMITFLEMMDAGNRAGAAACLDLRHLDKQTAAVKGPVYAYQLKETLDRMARIDVERLPADPETPQPFVVGSILKDKLRGDDLADADHILLSLDEDGLWRFSQETVNQIDDLYSRWRDRPLVPGLTRGDVRKPFSLRLQERFPARFHGTTFLLPDYQWICLAVLIFLGFLADLLVRQLMHYLARAWIRLRQPTEQLEFERKLWRPVGLLAQALVWYGGTTLIGLPDWALMVLLAGLKLFAVIAALWTVFLLINLLASYFAGKATDTSTKFDDLLIPLVSKSLKGLAVVVGIVTCAEIFSLPIYGFLGGLGLVGAALALASKDAVSNFFGSVTVLVDRPFEIGDWVVTNSIEGSVEAVGFRSTRVRTGYNSLITVPNSLLTTAVVDNMGRRQYRRFKTMISLQYDTTAEQIEAFCEGVRELIRRHPYTRKDYYHVYLNQFSESSIDVLLYCFVETPDWSMELRERHRLLVDIMKLAGRLGVQFAFPTRTLHMFSEPPPETGFPLDLSQPLVAGQQQAAGIAGPPLPPDRRPGQVEFPGPAPVELDDSGDSPESGGDSADLA